MKTNLKSAEVEALQAIAIAERGGAKKWKST